MRRASPSWLWCFGWARRLCGARGLGRMRRLGRVMCARWAKCGVWFSRAGCGCIGGRRFGRRRRVLLLLECVCKAAQHYAAGRHLDAHLLPRQRLPACAFTGNRSSVVGLGNLRKPPLPRWICHKRFCAGSRQKRAHTQGFVGKFPVRIRRRALHNHTKLQQSRRLLGRCPGLAGSEDQANNTNCDANDSPTLNRNAHLAQR